MKSRFYIWGIFFLISLPFFTFLNLFPFNRYAMYAEPIHEESFYEYFEIIDQNGIPIDIKKTNFPLPASYCNYMARKAFYKGDQDQFLNEISTSFAPFKFQTIKLQRTYGTPNHLKKEIVAQLPR